jgi:hypothetical protein
VSDTRSVKARDCAAVDRFADDPELKAMSEARQREYETAELLDRELSLGPEPEAGNDLMVKAAADLNVRGILLADASQAELFGALKRCSV